MQINNPLQMNDWEIKKVLLIVLTIQLTLWGVICLDTIGLQIPLLRQFIGFTYLTFVPGILFLKILRLHNLGNVKTIFYTVGLSIATLMFTGFFMNILFPLCGISHPISLWPLILTISIVVLILCIFVYIRDQSFSSLKYISIQEILSPQMLVLSLFPFAAIIGTYLVNTYHNNLLLMILILFIAIVPVVIAFTRIISEKYYPYVVFTLTIALLYHNALISNFIQGWDIQEEYFITNIVIQNGSFNFLTIYLTLSSMLSLVVLGPIYSIILNMGIDWVFKIIYPLLFAFVPLGFYELIRRQTDEKIAFFASFFLISNFTFYTDMLALARQEIAELFLVLMILCMIDWDLDKFQKTVFFLVFSTSLILSHYGLSYLFWFMLVLAFTISTVEYHTSFQKYIVQFFAWFKGKYRYPTNMNLQEYSFNPNPIHFFSVLWYTVFILIWYIYTAGSSSFIGILKIGSHVTSSISSEFLNTKAVQGAGLVMAKTASPLHEFFKYMYLLTLFFIVIGFVFSIIRSKQVRFDLIYLLLSFGALCICIAGVILPYFASALNTTRLFQICLILLAPFCVLGGITVISILSGKEHPAKNPLRILSIFFAIFLLFNSGWVFEIAKDHPDSISLSQDTIKNSPYIEDKKAFYDQLTVPEQNVFSARWFNRSVAQEPFTKVYVDINSGHSLKSYGMTPFIQHRMLSNTTINIDSEAFVFLGYQNIVENIARESLYQPNFNTSELSPLLSKINKIYSNKGSEIYYNGEKYR